MTDEERAQKFLDDNAEAIQEVCNHIFHPFDIENQVQG